MLAARLLARAARRLPRRGLASTSDLKPEQVGKPAAEPASGASPASHSVARLFLSVGRAQASLAAARWDAMLAEHHRLKTEDLPAASLSPAERAGGVDAEAVRRKRLVYRSKQRGWLEVDLLLGTWASACGARVARVARVAHRRHAPRAS